MRLLGISCAAKIISFGLVDEEKILAETTVSGNLAEKILFYVKEAGVSPDQIDGIAATGGPGSYSGLRSGLSTAKTLAETLDIPLVSVSTLEAIAFNLIDIEGVIAVVLDAKSDEYNFALFGAKSGKLGRLTEDAALKRDLIIDKLSKVSGILHLAGNTAEFKGALKRENFRFADETNSHPFGVNTAKLGLLKIKSGQRDDPQTLVPRYSHNPTIVGKPNVSEFML